MKLISYSEFSTVILAKFSLDNVEYFFEHYERLGYMKVSIAETDEDIGLTQDQCADILNELKKQYSYGRKK